MENGVKAVSQSMVLCDGKAHTPAGDVYLLAGFFFGDTDGKESGGRLCLNGTVAG